MATTEDRELVRMGDLTSDAPDEPAPAFVIGRPALISLKAKRSRMLSQLSVLPFAVQNTKSPSKSAKFTGMMVAMPSAP